MNDIIVAAPDGTELRSMLYSEYDFEIGDEENSFLVTMPRDEWEAVQAPGIRHKGQLCSCRRSDVARDDAA